jgi:hypothetical protein
VITLRDERPRVRFLAGARRFLLPNSVQISGPPQLPVQCVPGALPLGLKRPGLETSHLHVVPRFKWWNYISTPSYVFVSWYLMIDAQEVALVFTTNWKGFWEDGGSRCPYQYSSRAHPKCRPRLLTATPVRSVKCTFRSHFKRILNSTILKSINKISLYARSLK